MGRYKNPEICNPANLRAVSQALQQCTIAQRHFEEILNHAKPGDLVYFDPPYHPVSKTANFTSYHKEQFGEDAQRALAGVFGQLSEAGVKVLLSNSDTPLIRELYKPYKVETVLATRLVNSNAEKRGKVREVLVRNF
jgi:DNA adenine methylase